MQLLWIPFSQLITGTWHFSSSSSLVYPVGKATTTQKVRQKQHSCCGDYNWWCHLLVFWSRWCSHQLLLRKPAGMSDARRPARALGTAAVQSVLGVPKLWLLSCLLQSRMLHSMKEDTLSHLPYVDHSHVFGSQISNSKKLSSLDNGN